MLENLNKMDILFYNSIRRAKRNYYVLAGLHCIKAIMLSIFLPIDANRLASTNTLIIWFMIVGIATSTFSFFAYAVTGYQAYADDIDNNLFFCRLALGYGHTVPDEHVSGRNVHHLQNCVSARMYNVINSSEIDSEGLTETIKLRYEENNANIINGTVMRSKPCLSCWINQSKFASVVTIIFGIVALCLQNRSTPELAVCITYLILEGITIWLIVLVVLAIALSPILCIGGCFYLMCCYDGQPMPGSNQNVPAPVEATSAMIEQSEGSCAICLQNFDVGQNVTILPCSSKHMFHSICLNGWLNVANTCPTCRYNLS